MFGIFPLKHIYYHNLKDYAKRVTEAKERDMKFSISFQK